MDIDRDKILTFRILGVLKQQQKSLLASDSTTLGRSYWFFFRMVWEAWVVGERAW